MRSSGGAVIRVLLLPEPVRVGEWPAEVGERLAVLLVIVEV